MDSIKNRLRPVYERIAKDELKREAKWTEAIAVGSERFVREMADRIRGRQQLVIAGTGESWTLKEPTLPCVAIPGPEAEFKIDCYR